MKKIHGIGVSDGIALGRLVLYRSRKEKIQKHHVTDVKSELIRLEAAQKNAVDELNEIYLQSLKQVGEKDSMIFQIHMMMIQDEDFSQTVREKIKKEQINAEYAVWTTGNEFAERFAQMNDEYMRGRIMDVIDISRRLIQCLDNTAGNATLRIDESSIIAADELTPSETMQLDKSKVLAIVTRGGSKISHSSILSRTMGIPSVIGLEGGFAELKDGMFAVVDGSSGEIILEPDKNTKKGCEKRRNEYLRNQQELRELFESKAVTKDGIEIEINANIGHPEDTQSALENGADGIGLFRSEFLYMECDYLPTEEDQFQAYKTVLEKMQGRPVIIRTFDIGADKPVPYLNLPKETNPALGYRAIRICLDRKEMFYTQLRALLRASVFGRLKTMFPMIISVEEVREARAVMEQVKTDLTAEKIAFATDVETGIMIETPAAVMLSEELAKECDFFSIGTNDLTQYTLAVDRMNGKISKLYDQRHPAVLKMIEATANSARKAGIPVGICGESAADPALTKFYLKIGISELSVAPSSILGLKKTICGTDLS
jgi:phosphotransferase system enzyme I (PtsI)